MSSKDVLKVMKDKSIEFVDLLPAIRDKER